MVDPLNVRGPGPGIRPERLEPAQLRVPQPVARPGQDGSFKDMLTEAIGEVQRLQNEADTTIQKLVAGEITDITETMVAVEKADVAFQTMMLVRNKMVQAYEEIMRTQV